MSSIANCIACEEPLEPAATSCIACGTRHVRPPPSKLWIYVGLSLFVALETYCIAQDGSAVSLGIAATAIAFLYCLAPKTASKRKREMAEELAACRDFEAAKLFFGCDGKSGLAIDRRRSRICLLRNDGRKTSHRITSHSDILSAELIENGRTVISTARLSFGGNAISGPTHRPKEGAVLAALTGKAAESPSIWQLDLRIVVSDSTLPPHNVAFLSTEVAKGGVAYGKVNLSAVTWFRMMDAFIQRAELEEIRARDGNRSAKPKAARRAGLR